MNTESMIPTYLLPKLQQLVDNSPIQKAIKRLVSPRAPSWCQTIMRRGTRHHGVGGNKLSRKRLIKKWMKIRPGKHFPKGSVTRKICRIHYEVNSMYYPTTC
jgi:hypothetical protein